MTVYVIWDRLLEHVICAHKTEEGARKHVGELNHERTEKDACEWCLDFDYDEFPLED